MLPRRSLDTTDDRPPTICSPRHPGGDERAFEQIRVPLGFGHPRRPTGNSGVRPQSLEPLRVVAPGRPHSDDTARTSPGWLHIRDIGSERRNLRQAFYLTPLVSRKRGRRAERGRL